MFQVQVRGYLSHISHILLLCSVWIWRSSSLSHMLLGCDAWMRCSKLGQCHKCRLTVVRFADAVFMLTVTCFVAM